MHHPGRFPILGAALVLVALVGCTASRIVRHNISGIGDYRIFDGRPVRRAGPVHEFVPAPAEVARRARGILETAGADGSSTADSLEDAGVVCLLIARGDTLLYERYLDEDYPDSAWVASFSVAKSFVSALVGIAIDEGRIKSLDQPAADFIPEWRDRGLGGVTVRHLLRMTSGLKFSESYLNPFGDAAVLYYGSDLGDYVDHAKPEEPPGRRFNYISLNTQALAEIVVRATGVPLASYLESRIWQPLGMEADASWSLDSRRHGMEKGFCCLNARARDFARFGLLYLDEGRCGDRQVLPRSWVRQTSNPDTTQGGSPCYGLHWWLGDPEEGDYCAEGLHGQFIHVDPTCRTVTVMLSRKDSAFGPRFFRRTARRLCGWEGAASAPGPEGWDSMPLVETPRGR